MLPGVVSLLWFPPPLENQNGDIIGYLIRIIDQILLESENVEINSAVTNAKIGGLKTVHAYNFSVATVTTEGWGPFSYPVSIITLFGSK